MSTAIAYGSHLLTRVMADVPPDLTNIEAGAPPGSGAAVSLLQWGLWIAFAFCVGGIIKASGGLAWAGIGRGSSGDHGSGLGWAIVGTILCGSVGTIVTLVS